MLISEGEKYLLKNRKHTLFPILIAIILLQNIILANEVYTSQKVLYDRAVSITTRILNEIEKNSEYESGKTKIILVGDLYNNVYIPKLESNLSWYHGSKKIAITYKQTFESMAFLLGSDINREKDETIIKQYSKRKEVEQMEMYPKSGYCKNIDNVIVVKLSN